MKTLISIFAVALALAFTGPAFAQDVKTAKTAADCAKLAAYGMLRPIRAQRKRCKSHYRGGVGFGRRSPHAGPLAVGVRPVFVSVL
jgi:hypothetical protein